MKFTYVTALEEELEVARNKSTSEYWEALGKVMGAEAMGITVEPIILAAQNMLLGWGECPECGVEDMVGEHPDIDPPFNRPDDPPSPCSIGGLRNALVNLKLEKE